VNPPELDAILASDFSREEISARHNLPGKKFLVFCVGQFIDRKGRWIFLEAAKEIASVDSDVGFVWISNSRISAEDENRIRGFELGESFRLIFSDEVGKQRADLFCLMRAADVFVLASYVEGLPISLLEAMALRIPSVSTNVYAIPEAIINLETGILIEPGNADQLANAVIQLKNDLELRKRLAANGREYVLKNFDERESARIAWQAYVKSFER
jgi:glycosyltransferase involved in cell wall biosynthesis